MEEKEMTIDLKVLFNALVKRWWIIVLATLVLAGSFFAYSYLFKQKKYTSYTTLYVANNVENASTISSSELSAADTLANSYIEIITSDTTMENVSDRINGQYSAKQIKGMVSVGHVSETAILKISVTCASAADAKILANLVEAEGEKEISRVVNAGKVSVVDTASDAVQTSPNNKRSGLIGALFGFVISAGIVIIIELLDKRIKRIDQLGELFGYDIIGVIPAMNGGNGK